MSENTGRRCVNHLTDELECLIDRFVQEYDITPVEVVGTFAIVMFSIMADAYFEDIQEDEDED